MENNNGLKHQPCGTPNVVFFKNVSKYFASKENCLQKSQDTLSNTFVLFKTSILSSKKGASALENQGVHQFIQDWILIDREA